MHFKRKRRKNARAGCLLCKPHKANGNCPRHRNMRFGNFKRYCGGTDQLRCEGVVVSGRWRSIGG
jgi:hypothetical protein